MADGDSPLARNASPYFRGNRHAAADYARRAHDEAAAARLAGQGCDVYRSRSQALGIDLASEGSLVIPLGPELKGGRFFRTKAASMAAAYTESFRDACSAGAITVPLTSITLNTPLDMRRDGVLLVEEGTVPVGNYRLAHETFRGLVASAIEEMKRRQLLSPVAVVFHPLPIKPGNRIHLHAHLIASEVPDSNRPLIAEFLEDRFGSKRVWMSEPDERGRDAFATFAYPLWRSVETDTNKLIEDDRLLAVFYHQTHGLRFVQPLGGFHEWRARNAKERAGGISTAHRQSKDGLAGGDREFGTPPLTSDETDNRSATASSSGPEKLTASADRLGHQAVDAPNSGTIDHPYPHDKQSRLTADEPTIIHGVSAVWIGQARRVIARVSHYRGWQALVSEFQLAGHISEAKRLAQCATDSLLYDTAAMPPADHHGSNHHSNVSPVSAARQPAKPRSADSAVTPKSPSQSASGKPKVPTPTADVLRPSVVDVTAAHVRLTGSDGKHEQAPKPTAKTANQRDRGADVDASTAATAGKKGPTPTKTAGAAAERTAGGPTPQASADLDGKPATPHAGTGQNAMPPPPGPAPKTAGRRDRGSGVDASTQGTAGEKGPTPTKTADAAAERAAGGPTPQASADLDGKPATPHAGTGQNAMPPPPGPAPKTAGRRDRGSGVDASTQGTAGEKGPTPTKTADAAAERAAGGPTPQASADLDAKPATPHADVGQGRMRSAAAKAAGQANPRVGAARGRTTTTDPTITPKRPRFGSDITRTKHAASPVSNARVLVDVIMGAGSQRERDRLLATAIRSAAASASALKPARGAAPLVHFRIHTG